MNRVHVAWLAMAATLAAAAPAVAQQPTGTGTPAGDRWTITAAPYLWAAAMDGHAAVAGIKSDVDVPVEDVLKDLSFGAMLAVDIEKGRFGIGFNGLFARVSPDSKVGDIKIDVTSDSGQLAILPFYRLLEWQYGVSSSGAEGKEANWVPTDPDGRFEVLFRLYGPEKPFFDKVWVLPDIERIAAQ